MDSSFPYKCDSTTYTFLQKTIFFASDIPGEIHTLTFCIQWKACFTVQDIKHEKNRQASDIMARAKADADRDNRERWEREGRIAPTKKQDMEL